MVSLAKTNRMLFPVIGLFVLIASLYLTSLLIENSQLFDEYRLWLIGFVILMSVVFAALIIANTVRLIYSYIKKRSGSKLTLRLVVGSVLLMLIPAAGLYLFSTWLVEKGVDSWFDIDVENALNSSLELSRWSLNTRMQSLHEQVQAMATEVSTSPEELASLTLKDYVETEDGPGELMLLRSNREVIASASKETVGSLLVLPPEAVLREVIQSDNPYSGLDPVGEGEIYIRFVFPVPSAEVLGEMRFLHALYPVSARVSRLASEVEQAYGKYNRLVFSRNALKQSFIWTLTLVLFSGVLYAGWAAFVFARRLTQPISVLDEATQAVAAGKLETRLETTSKDEFGSLVESFNEMIRRLSVAQKSADMNRLQLERQRGYLQTVLEHISSGVISFNSDNVLRTVNTTAAEILAMPLNEWLNKPLEELVKDSQVGSFFSHCLGKITNANGKEWDEQIDYHADGQQRILFCYGTHLPDGGSVIVVNDITNIVQAQRHRTWSEIAQRMAHEFKNPLTPIQLSAERLNKKLGTVLDPENNALLERSTVVITQQVEAMRRIVDDFRQFAQAVPMDVRDVDINSLIQDVVELYQANIHRVRIDCQLAANLPLLHGDAGRIRQLLHNLLTNATDALKDTKDPQITIVTRSDKSDTVKISVRDNGPGFDEKIIDNAFEPYVTSRTEGTGLGLAIVKRIVEEHNGHIQINNLNPGAEVSMVLRKFYLYAAKQSD